MLFLKVGIDCKAKICSMAMHCVPLQRQQSVCRYKESSVKDDRRAVVGELCCLGAGTRVMDDATVARSVIGRHCTIRPGATVEDSFVMSGVTIGAGAARMFSAHWCVGWPSLQQTSPQCVR